MPSFIAHSLVEAAYDTRPMADPEILAIERVAFDAWPAAEVRALGGWRLRFNHGVTSRGSSVWPGPGASEGTLDARLAAVERFYAERGAAACYQLCPAADPPELDAVLAARGYEVVTMKIDEGNNFTADTIASVLTSGLLGEVYVGLDVGGDTKMLGDGARIGKTQSAVVLEKLIGQFLFDKAAAGSAK
jgi:hypothetical protein